MNKHKNSKLYLLIIGFLLVTNVALLWMLNNKKSDAKYNGKFDKGAMLKDFLQKEIGFNNEQIVQFDTIAKLQRAAMKANFEAIKKNKENQLKLLGSLSFSDSAIAQMANQSAENQKVMELQMLNHLAAIRKLCTAEQLPKFDSTFYTVWKKKKKEEVKK